jgi:hypothetical protein
MGRIFGHKWKYFSGTAIIHGQPMPYCLLECQRCGAVTGEKK